MLVALGIRHVGGEVAVTLANHFGSIDAIMEATAEQITDIPGIGQKIADSVVEWFANEDNRAVVEKLRPPASTCARSRAARARVRSPG